MKIPSSMPKTAALKKSAVTNVDVDALAALDKSEDLRARALAADGGRR